MTQAGVVSPERNRWGESVKSVPSVVKETGGSTGGFKCEKVLPTGPFPEDKRPAALLVNRS
jgi:hypothetical protein